MKGGRPLRIIDEVRALTPVALHGVSINIRSTAPLDTDYLGALERLIERVDPSWVSDHLCWTGVGGHHLHDLLPLPYTEEAIRHVADRVRQVKDRLDRPVALENVSSYMTYSEDTLGEWEFLVAIVEEADCGILSPLEDAALAQIESGLRFDALCAWAADRVGDDDAPAQAAGWLAQWLGDAVLEGVGI